MKVVEIPQYGIDNLRVVERDTPQPGPGQVLVKMAAASLNYRDLVTVLGAFGAMYKLPLVPLSDACGEVVAVGPGVTRVKTGDRVASMFFQRWLAGELTREGQASAIGGSLDGVWRDYALLSADGVSKVPSYLSDAEVATLSCAALTAWRSLMVEGGLKAGETVVVQGTGGVSIFALQFAKAAGAEVIITSSSDEKLARAKALGADHLVNYKQTPDWSKAVREITDGRGADHVVEVGGAGTLEHSLKSIRVGGHVSVVGVLSGHVKDLQIGMVMSANAKVKGITVGSREQFEAMCRAMTLHKIKPVIDKTFPFAAAKEALTTMMGQGHFGKIAIDLAA
ncbi:MAG: NAD(P)-dependent alcohol dehydrogenase [Alphaproteobacteria bacterium]|jgi:NADPH:quinone reductase-like Zn-dependent oxidoreductase|nr:NAD(P)-dependent alcohol dehydrogenase [Alphaproteobacteria bacterium]